MIDVSAGWHFISALVFVRMFLYLSACFSILCALVSRRRRIQFVYSLHAQRTRLKNQAEEIQPLNQFKLNIRKYYIYIYMRIESQRI